MKTIKLIITIFFIIISYWITYLIFRRNFANAKIAFAVDNWTENTFMILLLSTSLSIVGVFFTGILSMFVHFIFIKLIYADEIKQAAYFYIKNRNKKEPIDLNQYCADVDKNSKIKNSNNRFTNVIMKLLQTLNNKN